MNGDGAELAEVGMKRVAFLREDDASERAGKHDVPGLERVTVRADLVGKPGHAQRRMTEHAGSQTCLLDFGIGPTGRPPIAMPAAAPLSATVSTILRGSWMRASTISIAGTTYSVARRTSVRPTPGPCSLLPMMKASSTSTRGLQ